MAVKQFECALNNDSTNGCAFLSVKIADTILSEVVAGSEFFTELPEAIEDTIWHLPETIKEHRDLHRLYDAMEVYVIIREHKIITSPYDFSEELPFDDTVFSFEGRQKLHSKLCELGCNDFVATFTCELLALTISCCDGKPYMVNTHPVMLAPGKGKGLLMIGKKNSLEVWLSLCICFGKGCTTKAYSPTRVNHWQVFQVNQSKCYQQLRLFVYMSLKHI